MDRSRLVGGVVLALAAVVLVPLANQWYGEYKEKLAEEDRARHAAEALAKRTRQAAEALAECDASASHPSDPQRFAAPVSDDKVALGAAVAACELAVERNPSIARAHFQLGRVYWLSKRDEQGFAAFVRADEPGHMAAAKYIGDALFEERGLPKGIQIDDEVILGWYRKAEKGGFSGIIDSIARIDDRIRRSRFDPNYFQYADYMQALFSGSFDKFKAPVALAYYVQGVVKRLDDDQTIFMDHKCKALLNIIGNKVIDYADALAISLELAKSQNRSIEENMAALLRGTFDMFVGAPIYRDYGARDATVLFDQEVYGCNSPVTQQVIANIMLRLNQRPR